MKLSYWLIRIVLKIIDWLPLGFLYAFSSPFSRLINSVFRYRKDVVTENLRKSFPEKTVTQIALIEKGFYHHFTDLLLEIIKLESLSEAELFRRVTVSGNQVLDTLLESKKGVVVVMSHSGNWEWISQRVCFEGRRFEYTGVVAKEVSNPYFEKYFSYIRMRLQKGFAEIIPYAETARHLAKIRHKTSMLITIADQTPHQNLIQYRTDFLHQDSGVFLGPERIAKSLNYAVVFCHVQKKERGFYHLEFELVTDKPKHNPPLEITDLHVKMLEKDIQAQPEIWLWSHRRWKY